jgi:hypothetical protein
VDKKIMQGFMLNTKMAVGAEIPWYCQSAMNRKFRSNTVYILIVFLASFCRLKVRPMETVSPSTVRTM